MRSASANSYFATEMKSISGEGINIEEKLQNEKESHAKTTKKSN